MGKMGWTKNVMCFILIQKQKSTMTPYQIELSLVRSKRNTINSGKTQFGF